MSKIGRKPIDFGNVHVECDGREVHFKGKNASGVHIIPEALEIECLGGKKLKISCPQLTRENKILWGLHRALLANKIMGADKGFESELNINGLGFKGVLSGDKIVFSLGFSHKIDFLVPKGVSVEIDKTGQIIKIKGWEKEQVGLVASRIRSLRPAEPYKLTGVKLKDEFVVRKAGKTKSA